MNIAKEKTQSGHFAGTAFCFISDLLYSYLIANIHCYIAAVEIRLIK